MIDKIRKLIPFKVHMFWKNYINEYPYYAFAALLIFLKIFGIIKWSWWIVTLPIWWWWPLLIMAGIFVAIVIVGTDFINRTKK